MKKRVLWALAALNLLLVVTLAVRMSGENQAVAQVNRPSDYILVPGEVGGGASAIVYVIDSSNGLLGAMTYDDAQKNLKTMPPLDLSRVFQTGPANAPRGPAAAPGARAPGR